jgi:hypothetical protein
VPCKNVRFSVIWFPMYTLAVYRRTLPLVGSPSSFLLQRPNLSSSSISPPRLHFIFALWPLNHLFPHSLSLENDHLNNNSSLGLFHPPYPFSLTLCHWFRQSITLLLNSCPLRPIIPLSCCLLYLLYPFSFPLLHPVPLFPLNLSLLVFYIFSHPFCP